jgi:hypothetical protein
VAGRRGRFGGTARLGLRAAFDFSSAFREYLLPTIKERYQ